MLLILALRRQGQVGFPEFSANLIYIASLRPARAMESRGDILRGIQGELEEGSRGGYDHIYYIHA